MPVDSVCEQMDLFFRYEFHHKRCSFFFPIRFNQMSSNGILCEEHKFYHEWNIFAKCTHKCVRFVWSFYSHVLTARYITQRVWNAPCINLDAIKCRNVVGYKWNWKVISICAYAFHSRHHFLFFFFINLIASSIVFTPHLKYSVRMI